MAAQNHTSEETAVRQLIDDFQQAIRAKDLSRVLSVYAPDIVSFNLVPPCSMWVSPPIADPGKRHSRPSRARSAMRSATYTSPRPTRSRSVTASTR
jgi:hypothetical protein